MQKFIRLVIELRDHKDQITWESIPKVKDVDKLKYLLEQERERKEANE